MPIASASPPPAAAPSRRELNKAATRQSITDAALALLRSSGPGNFTVEDIADAAGISRRTFFNYFSSTDAALASITHGFLNNAIQQLQLRLLLQARQPPTGAAVRTDSRSRAPSFTPAPWPDP